MVLIQKGVHFIKGFSPRLTLWALRESKKLCMNLLFVTSLLISQALTHVPATSPLAAYSSEWNNEKYLVCNTAAKADYMSANEKELIYVLNLARMNPVLFANSVVKKFPNKIGEEQLRKSAYYNSLLDSMVKMKPLSLLYPDEACYTSAACHAKTTGADGSVGHDRSDDCRAKMRFSAECCDYGHSSAVDIIMSLLVDEGVKSLGHRKICLWPYYEKIGVSIQPHKIYRFTAVLDFQL
jgi:hypothetical protein